MCTFSTIIAIWLRKWKCTPTWCIITKRMWPQFVSNKIISSYSPTNFLCLKIHWNHLYCNMVAILSNILTKIHHCSHVGHWWVTGLITWWRHQMETFSALLALCAGNSPVTGEFPSQRPVTRSFDVFFDLSLNKQLSKQSRRRWFETILCSLWRQCNVMLQFPLLYTRACCIRERFYEIRMYQTI